MDKYLSHAVNPTQNHSSEAFVVHSHLNVSTNELSGGITIEQPFKIQQMIGMKTTLWKWSISCFVYDKMDAEGDGEMVICPPWEFKPSMEENIQINHRMMQQDVAYGKKIPGLCMEMLIGVTETYVQIIHQIHAPLVYAFRKTTNNYCDINSLYDGGLSGAYGDTMCKVQLNSAALVSAQMYVQTWGQMGAGDPVALELWRGNGAPEIHSLTILQTIYLAQVKDNGATFHGTLQNN